MSDLYLIAHKVRGEAAFDVAHQMQCPICAGQVGEDYIECDECDSLGYWWIIPTSGHRAYPFWNITFDDLAQGFIWETVIEAGVPDPWPDHYTTREAPRVDLSKLFRSNQPKMERKFL